MADFRHERDIELSESLQSLVDMGRERMADMRVVFLAILRGHPNGFRKTLARIEELGSYFKEWTAAFYENDSGADMPAMLREWAREHPQVIVSCNVLHTRRWPSRRMPDRGTDMAWYRNQCKLFGRGMLQAADTVICLDPDLGPNFLLNGICTTYGHWGHWDAVFANGLRWDGVWVQADAWPFRRHSWAPMMFRQVRGIVPAPTDPWIPVMSAFGGIACYTAKAYQSSDYAGQDCEHVPFHRGLVNNGYDRLFLNPAQIYMHPRKYPLKAKKPVRSRRQPPKKKEWP